jgi:hypothetical protein
MAKADQDIHTRLYQETLNWIEEVVIAATEIRSKLLASATEQRDSAATALLPHYVSANAAAVNVQLDTIQLLTRGTTDARLSGVTSLQDAITNSDVPVASGNDQPRTVAEEDPSYREALTRRMNAVRQVRLWLNDHLVSYTLVDPVRLDNSRSCAQVRS